MSIGSEDARTMLSQSWRTLIDTSVEANRFNPSVPRERELLHIRQRAFHEVDRTFPSQPEFDPRLALPIDEDVGLPVLRGTLDAGVVRSTIVAHGCVLVPGLLSGSLLADLRSTVEMAIAAQESLTTGTPSPDAQDWCHPFEPLRHRLARAHAHGVLAVDTPRGLCRYLDALEESGMLAMVRRYFGGPVAFSGEKTAFRKSNEVPPAGYGWHQDGAFLGGERIRTLDIWITLTPAGRTAPGLEILPRRVDRILPAGAAFAWDLSNELIERHYPEFSTVTPEFGAGDAILFDQLCVHRTGGPQQPTDTRISIECWMFGPESIPDDYTGFML